MVRGTCKESSAWQIAHKGLVTCAHPDVSPVIASFQTETRGLRLTAHKLHNGLLIVEKRRQLRVNILSDSVGQSRHQPWNESFELTHPPRVISGRCNQQSDVVNGVIAEIMKILFDLCAYGFDRTSSSDYKRRRARVPNPCYECWPTRQSSKAVVKRSQVANGQGLCDQSTPSRGLRSHSGIPKSEPYRCEDRADRADGRERTPNHRGTAARVFRNELDQCHV